MNLESWKSQAMHHWKEFQPIRYRELVKSSSIAEMDAASDFMVAIPLIIAAVGLAATRECSAADRFLMRASGSVRGRPADLIVSSDGAHPLGVLDRVNRCARLSRTDPDLFRPERALQTSEARWIASLRC